MLHYSWNLTFSDIFCSYEPVQPYSIYQALCFRVYNDDAIKCKYFPRYWPFVRGIHRSLVNSPHTGDLDAIVLITTSL